MHVFDGMNWISVFDNSFFRTEVCTLPCPLNCPPVHHFVSPPQFLFAGGGCHQYFGQNPPCHCGGGPVELPLWLSVIEWQHSARQKTHRTPPPPCWWKGGGHQYTEVKTWVLAHFVYLYVWNVILHEIYLGFWGKMQLLGKHSFHTHSTHVLARTFNISTANLGQDKSRSINLGTASFLVPNCRAPLAMCPRHGRLLWLDADLHLDLQIWI